MNSNERSLKVEQGRSDEAKAWMLALYAAELLPDIQSAITDKTIQQGRVLLAAVKATAT